MFSKDIPGKTSGKIVGTPKSDLLIATSFGKVNDDTIKGAQGDDLIAGSQGNDLILGEEGDDIISGADLNGDRIVTQSGGYSGKDTLTGGKGSDIFFLGGSFEKSLEGFYDSDVSAAIIAGHDRPVDNTLNNYYDAKGNSDYALITDFDLDKDVIHLDGAEEDYRLGASPLDLLEGIGIFQEKELIAIVQGEDLDLDLDANYFQY